ncbi:MAG: RNA polymerase sigma factor [Bacteroidia bacterium]
MSISKELLIRCRKKEKKAQFELYQDCYEFLMRICLRYEKNEDDAHAVLNLAFLKILNSLKHHNQKIPFEIWCKRITINTIIDEFRKNKKYKEYMQFGELDENGELEGNVLSEAENNLTAEDIEKMLQALPAMNRKIFNLHVIDGYTHKEIGQMMNISDGTSKWHVSNARSKLQQVLRQSFMMMINAITL